MKIYLVTGAAGFIGSALAKMLLQQGHKVVTIDNLSTGKESNIPGGVEFIKGDCQDVGVLRKLENYIFEAIFHLAGQSSGEISFDDPVYDLQTNTQSTVLLLQLAQKTACHKMVYASSMSVYGDIDVLPVTEKNSCQPKSFYAVGKLASENYLRIYQETGIQCTALRLFNVYGPGQNLENLRQGMVSIFLAQALNYNQILVKGSKNRFRDFVYIDDVVNAFLLVERASTESFRIYNVCTGVKTTVETLLGHISKNLSETPKVTFEGSTAGDQFGIYGDAGLLIDELNWNPTMNLVDGMKKMVEWAIKTT